MTSWCNRAVLKGVGLLLAGVVIAGSCQPAQAQVEVGNARILLTQVVDDRGRALVDFAVDDFVVMQGGKERELLDVHIADYPLALLLDDATDAETWRVLLQAARRFIGRVGERPVAVGVLSRTSLVADFADSRAAVLERLDRLAASPGAARMSLPLLHLMAGRLKELESPFAAMVVVSTVGEDEPSASDRELLPPILESGASIHVLAGHAAGTPPAERQGTIDPLKLLTEQAHGQYISIFTPSSYGVALDRLADRLSTEMMIEFLVPPDASGDLQVGVKRPGARVLGLGVSK